MATYAAPNKYTKKPLSVAEYAMMRGVTDFSNPAQFNLYEKGYQYLFVLAIPKYIEMLAGYNEEVKRLTNSFCNIMEQEFKGLDGLDDITTEDLEVTDGIATLNVIGKVVKQSTAEITAQYTEKSGAVITNFTKYYLEGIRDPRTMAKTYHGLIKNGMLNPGFENEVFTLLYIVTDNTLLMLEKAILMCNAYPTSAKTSIYEGTKGDIEKVDIDVNWRCFLIDNDEVSARAVKFLAKINEHQDLENNNNAVANAYKTISGDGKQTDAMKVANDQKTYDSNTVSLDSTNYQYSILESIDGTLGKNQSNE